MVLVIGLSLTRVPICDEGWYTSPALSLNANGGMGSPVIESAGIYLKGIQRYTFWEMPLHAIAAAPWFRLFGSTLISTRLLSAAAGLAALLCWFFIIGKITGDPTIALIALFLIAIDSNVLILASTGRSDMLSAAFGAAALAAYLALREDHLTWALFIGHACAVASGLTHPQGGLIAVPSLLLLHFYYDRRRLRWQHLLPVAVPYLIGAAAWGAYILQAPQFFWAQFSGNSAGRLWPAEGSAAGFAFGNYRPLAPRLWILAGCASRRQAAHRRAGRLLSSHAGTLLASRGQTNAGCANPRELDRNRRARVGIHGRRQAAVVSDPSRMADGGGRGSIL